MSARVTSIGKEVVFTPAPPNAHVTSLGRQTAFSVHNASRITLLGKQVVYSTSPDDDDGAGGVAPVLPGAQRTTLYLCEAQGARIIAFGIGNSQVGDNYQFELETWDLIPSGEVGDNLFRSINVALRAFGLFQIGITPIVDGKDLAEQVFSASGSGELTCQALVQSPRGARCAARVRTLSRGGDLEIENISITVVPVRVFP